MTDYHIFTTHDLEFIAVKKYGLYVLIEYGCWVNMLACHMPLLYNLPVYRSRDVGGSIQSDCASKYYYKLLLQSICILCEMVYQWQPGGALSRKAIVCWQGDYGTTEYSPEGLVGVHTFNRTITVVASVAINTTNFTCFVDVEGGSVSATAQLIVVGKY